MSMNEKHHLLIVAFLGLGARIEQGFGTVEYLLDGAVDLCVNMEGLCKLR